MATQTNKQATKPVEAFKAPVLITKAADIDKAIALIANRGKKLDADIHQAACSTLAHAINHGDVTLAQKLVSAMPKSGRSKALVAWFIAHGPFAPGGDDGKTLVYLKSESALDKALVTPFWTFTEEREPAPFDLMASLASLLARAEKALQNDKQDTSLIAPAALSALRTIVQPKSEETAAVTL